MDLQALIVVLPLLAGVVLDKLLGDPLWLPHPVVGFGRIISFFEHRLNHGGYRRIKGIFTALLLIAGIFTLSYLLLKYVSEYNVWLGYILTTIVVFYCLAGKTLIDEVRMVFDAMEVSLEKGRNQVSRIVGRDTKELSGQEVRAAALETLAENLSDGVIAPLFWFMILGVPGMLTYKMINTLDSMIGYKNERYRLFGCCAAKIDDAANFIPARITALLMVIASGQMSLLSFVLRYGREHASPNSGYPEAALAGILNCRFGGPHNYFGELVYKPFIGSNDRTLERKDADVAIRINKLSEFIMLVIMVVAIYISCGHLPLVNFI